VTSMAEIPDPLDWLEDEQRRPDHPRLEFRQQLLACDNRLVEVGQQVAEMVLPVTMAVVQADAHGAGAASVTAAAVDAGCRELEERCYVLIARQSPVAGDLRHLVALLRSIADVQRSGQLVRHVAGSLDWIHPPALSEDLRQLLNQLGTVSADIFTGGVEAWRRHDGLAATELDHADDEVDLLQKLLLTEIYTGNQSVEEAVSLALLARYFERIADHGVEMARQVTYFVTGERVVPSRR
jgi:phosphate transport system protein